MEPHSLRFGGGTPESLLHPLVILMLALAIVLILVLPRRHIITPLLLAIFFIPTGQVLVLAGTHLTAAKLLILATLVRAAIRNSLKLPGGFTGVDRAFALCALSYATIFSLQWESSQALIKTAGDLLDTLGGYFVLRFAISDEGSVRRVIKVLSLIAILSALCMMNEQVSRRNIFAELGGMPPTTVRDGKVRSQAAFEVFITAGAYGATVLPLIVSCWTKAKRKVGIFLAVVGASAMVITSHASTTLGAYAAGIVALCFWPLRHKMRFVRWGVIFAIIGLHLVMNGPVWSLIEKVDLTGSSSSYHRYMLVDNSIRHFGEWWLLGVKDYDKWGFDMWDLSDQYVAYAVNGGLLTLVLFVLVIARAFAQLGLASRRDNGDRQRDWLLWCLGASLFSHLVAFIGIGYFDQMQFAWYALLAMIVAATTIRDAVGSQSIVEDCHALV